MEHKTKFSLASIIIVMVILSLLIVVIKEKYNYNERIKSSQQSSSTPLVPECIRGDKKQCISQDGIQGYISCENGSYSKKCFIANLDDCKITSDKLFSVCCKASDGIIYDCNEKTDFKSGDYVIIKVNLQKALAESKANLETYKACIFSSLLASETEVPKQYEKGTAFFDQDVGCSAVFNANTYRYASKSGFIPQTKGKVVLSEIRVYPASTTLENSQDATNNAASSTSIYKFEVDVS